MFNFAYADDHPEQFSFQGFLKDTNDNPITATKDITLKIYTVLKGGSQLWFEEHDNVNVSNGLFNVYVGGQTPFSGSLNFTNTLYLEVIIENSDGSSPEILSPRLLVAAAPFALSASSASNHFDLNEKQIHNISALNLTQTDTLLAVNITNTGTGDSFRVNDDTSDSTPFLIDNLGNLLLGAISETISDSSFILDGSNAFFAGLLGVKGDIYTDGSLLSAGSVNATAANFTQSIGDSNQIVLDIVNEGTGDSFLVHDESGDTTPFVIDSSGNVGIGTPIISSILHADSNAANTIPIITIENTAGNIQLFRTDATPEGTITGSIGDIAVDSTHGKIYIKEKNNNLNTGWVEIGSTVDSSQIINGTITDVDVSSTAAISLTKLAQLANNFALVSNSTGDISVSNVTSTELGYLDGVTSLLQAQLDTKGSLDGIFSEGVIVSTGRNAINFNDASVIDFTVTDESSLNAGNVTASIVTGSIGDLQLGTNIDTTQLADGTVTSTEFQFINTLSSNAQIQIDEKLSGITGESIHSLVNVTSTGCASGQILQVSGIGWICATPSTVTTSTDLSDTSTLARSSDDLGFFSETSSSQLADTINDETGSGLLVLGTSPTITTPTITTPTIDSFANSNHDHSDTAGAGQLTDTALSSTASIQLTKLTQLTNQRVLVSNSTGDIDESTITVTELGYLDDVTSPLQTQLNDKLSDVTSQSIHSLSNVTSTGCASGEILQVSGTGWICATLVSASTDLSDTDTLARSSDDLGFFSETSSSQLAGIISNKTGTGSLVFGTSPTITTPTITGDLIVDTTTLFVDATNDRVGINTSTPDDTLDVNGNIILTNDDSGTNRNINFGSKFGAPALTLYDGGPTGSHGWGLQPGAMQFFQVNPSHIWTWTLGGSLQPTGTNEVMRLSGAGLLGIGTSPSTTLHADSNAANTIPIITIENTAGNIQLFRTDATPDGIITGSIGDIAVDSTYGKIYIKKTGNSINTGWVEIGSTVDSSQIINGTITDVDVSSTAAISLTKLAQLTNQRVLVSNSTGDIDESTITVTELGYLDDVTSPLQTQLNDKLSDITGESIHSLSNVTSTGCASGQILQVSGTGWICATPSTVSTSTDLSDTDTLARSSDDLGFFSETTSSQLAGIISNKTGTGSLVFGTSPTITTPTITSFANSNHDHSDTTSGGELTDSALISGVFGAITGLGTQTQDLAMGTNKITGLGEPVLSQDATTKNYVDTQGFVTKVGTPINNQIGVWTGDGTLEGDPDLFFDTITNTLTLGSGTLGNPRGNFIINSFYAPTFEMSEFDIGGNNRRWQTTIDSGILTHSLLTDAGAVTPYQTINRSLSTATSIEFTTSNFKVSGNQIVTGTLDMSNQAINNILTLNTNTIPAGTDTFAMLTATQPLTNKSISLTNNILTGNSAELATAISDETGTGSLVFGTSPTITTPTIASFVNANHDHSTSINGGQLTDTALSTSAGIQSTKIADGTVTSTEFQFINTLSSNAQTQINEKLSNITDQSIHSLSNVTSIGCASGQILQVSGIGWICATLPSIVTVSTDLSDTDTLARSSDNLGFFSETTSSQLADTINDETGSGLLVFGTSPALITPTITGDLIVDTNTLFVDANLNRVGIGTITPAEALHIEGATGVVRAQIKNTNSAGFADVFLFNDANKFVGFQMVGSNIGGTFAGIPLANLGKLVAGTDNFVIGNSNNAPVQFITNAIERMRILGDGNFDFKTNDIVNLGSLNTNTIPAGTDTFAMLNAAQTLTSKTLTTPTIASFVNANHDHSTSINGGQLTDTALSTSAGIQSTKIADGTVTSTEFQFINTLSSNAQTQINEKLSNITDQSIHSLSNVTSSGCASGQILQVSGIGWVCATPVTTSTDLSDTDTLARNTNTLDFFSETSSSQLAGTISDETGSGLLVFGTSPALTTPTITGDLIVDTTTLFADSTNNRVGIGTIIPDNTLSVIGDMDIANADTATKAYRLRTSGGALDFEAGGANLYFGVFTNPDFTGTQYNYIEMSNTGAPMKVKQDTDFTGKNIFGINNAAINTINTNTIPAGTDTFAMLDTAQTLASKTLTTPTIASFVNANHDHSDTTGAGQLNDTALSSTAAIQLTKLAQLTNQRVLVSNSTGDIDESTITVTELGYLDDVTSPLQTQLNDKLSDVTSQSIHSLSNVTSTGCASGEILQVSGTGWICATLLDPTTIVDTDSDTKIQTEKTANENKIRFDTAGTERMIIDNMGNVGIGTNIPSQKLTLVGGNFLQNPADPTLTGKLIDAANMEGASSVYVSGKYAYVTGQQSDSLAIIDITNPSAPTLTGKLIDAANMKEPISVYVSGKYAYVIGQQSESLAIIDITNSSAPILTGSFTDPTGNENPSINMEQPSSVYVSGKYAYVTGRDSDSLAIIDITNPSAPTLTGSLLDTANMENASSVYVSGKYAYVTGKTSSSLAIVDISNPSAPTLTGKLIDAANMTFASSVYVSGKYAYVTGELSNSLAIVDVSNPSDPTLAGKLIDADNMSFASSVYVSGKYAYVTGELSNSLAIVDVSNPSAPTLTGKLIDPTNMKFASSVYVSGKYAYVTGQDSNSLAIIDIAGIDSPSANIGNIEAGNISVTNNVVIANNLYSSGLNVGINGIHSDGNISTAGNFTASMINGTLLDIIQTENFLAVNITNNGTGGSFRVNDEPGDTTPFVIDSSGNVGINTADPDDSLDVVGNIDATGCIKTGNTNTIGGTCTSDIRLKQNINSLSNSIAYLTQLNPVSFEWIPEMYDISKENGTSVGLIAQEVEKVFPHLVTTDESGYKKIRYDIELSMYMIQAIKEQQQEIESLKELICIDYPDSKLCDKL